MTTPTGEQILERLRAGTYPAYAATLSFDELGRVSMIAAPLLGSHRRLWDEAHDLYGQARKDGAAAFIGWVAKHVPEPLAPAVYAIHHGVEPAILDSRVWDAVAAEETLRR